MESIYSLYETEAFTCTSETETLLTYLDLLVVEVGLYKLALFNCPTRCSDPGGS